MFKNNLLIYKNFVLVLLPQLWGVSFFIVVNLKSLSGYNLISFCFTFTNNFLIYKNFAFILFFQCYSNFGDVVFSLTRFFRDGDRGPTKLQQTEKWGKNSAVKG